MNGKTQLRKEKVKMRKNIKDLALYLKDIIVPESHEIYPVKPILEDFIDDIIIRTGVNEFRIFLIKLFDLLIAEGDAYDNYKKIPHEYENRITLSVNFPFLHNVRTIMMNLGIQGVFKENKDYLFCNSNLFDPRVSISKSIEALKFLIVCGLEFDGVNLDDKKTLLETNVIKVSYPKNPQMLIGLKVMAIAEVRYGSLVKQDVFLRCDYRVLINEAIDIKTIIKEIIKPLSIDLQNFVLSLHQHSINKGYKTIVEIKGFWIYIKYLYKRKEIWGLNTSLNNGLHINIKATNMPKYPAIIETFPKIMKDVISKGFGCGRKISSIGHCNGGCRGMTMQLDNYILDLSDDIIKWFDAEIVFC
jgi:hypothetical protein